MCFVHHCTIYGGLFAKKKKKVFAEFLFTEIHAFRRLAIQLSLVFHGGKKSYGFGTA